MASDHVRPPVDSRASGGTRNCVGVIDVEVGRAARCLIDELVSACAAVHSQDDLGATRASNHGSIVAAAKIESNFASLRRIEPPPEVPLLCAIGGSGRQRAD